MALLGPNGDAQLGEQEFDDVLNENTDDNLDDIVTEENLNNNALGRKKKAEKAKKEQEAAEAAKAAAAAAEAEAAAATEATEAATEATEAAAAAAATNSEAAENHADQVNADEAAAQQKR